MPAVEDFESGWGDWYTDNGVWQGGAPAAGPINCPSGTQCAGTDLEEVYAVHTDSRLISPVIKLPQVSGDQRLEVRVLGRQSGGPGPDS